MRPIGDIIWCGVSAPVIQGIFVGLGVSAVGLIVFPFAFIPMRPPAGIQSSYRRATTYLKWSRRAAWALGFFASITLGGYIVLYTDASGRFCTERFDGHMLLGVYIWSAMSGITFFLLVVIAFLRGLTYHLTDKSLLAAAAPPKSKWRTKHSRRPSPIHLLELFSAPWRPWFSEISGNDGGVGLYRITQDDYLLFQRRAKRFAVRDERLRDEDHRTHLGHTGATVRAFAL